MIFNSSTIIAPVEFKRTELFHESLILLVLEPGVEPGTY